MSAIFISYTGRDDDGEAIAEQVAVWLREWGYESFFRDQELIEGVPAGRDWRQLLHARMAQCRLLIAVCSPKYEQSAWCMAEVAIAMDRGHKLVPLVVGGAKLPLLLQNRQAITIQESIELAAGAADEGPEEARGRIAALQERLERALDDLLDWRAKMPRLADHTSPYPGLLSFDESTATVFYGRDEVIDALEKKVLELPGHRSEFLLLQGASGSGKSSLLRSGLIPRLRNEKGAGISGGGPHPFGPAAAAGNTGNQAGRGDAPRRGEGRVHHRGLGPDAVGRLRPLAAADAKAGGDGGGADRSVLVP